MVISYRYSEFNWENAAWLWSFSHVYMVPSILLHTYSSIIVYQIIKCLQLICPYFGQTPIATTTNNINNNNSTIMSLTLKQLTY